MNVIADNALHKSFFQMHRMSVSDPLSHAPSCFSWSEKP